MTESRGTDVGRINRWPFILADLLLLLIAVVTYAQGQHWPFGDRVGLAPWEGWVLTACVFLGAGFSVMPFLLEHRLWARVTEIGRVQKAMDQVKNIEQAARQIHSATASWQAVQDDASKAVEAARVLQERMTTEVRSLQEFLQRASENERAHLRLEVDKLRRAEGEWLQVLVRVLDHVWALYQAAVRSGKVNLVEQLSHFQRACRDAAQRVGLVPFTAHQGDAWDPELHQLARPEDENRCEFPIADTVATGFRYQGQVVRKALVVLQAAPVTESVIPAAADESAAQTAPPFESSYAMPPSESPREVAPELEPELEPELAGIADPDSPGQTAEIAAVAEDAATAGSHTAPPEGTPPQLASAEEQIWNRAEPMEMGFWRDAEPPDAPADPGRGEEEEGEGRSAGPGKG